MSIPRYRIGNDLTVLWAINNRDGSPYDLSQKVVRLFVTHPRDRIEVETIVETLPGGEVNNVIRWDFSGLEQRVLGTYMLTAEIYTSEDKKLIRKDISEAFALVSRSEMENEEGGEEVMDGGELFLSSKLDIYRFGIPKIKIGTNGNWYIDGVDTRVSALGGGPGLVNEVYTHEDFDKTFDPSSVVDAFNAHAVASLARRLRVLEADDYLQIRNMTDVLYVGELQNGQVLAWDGTRWTNKEPQGGGGGTGTSEEIKSLLKLLDWFELDESTGLIKANRGFYSVGPITALGKASDAEFPYAVNRLASLRDVRIENPKNGHALIYDSERDIWTNALSASGEGGNAALTSDIKVDVAVGYISKNYTLPEGLTFTEFVELMFSQGIKSVKPTIALAGVPAQSVEVGSSISLNLSSTFKDGYFANTDEGTTQAGCQPEDESYTLDGKGINTPHSFTASSPKVHTVAVSQPYGASSVKPVKGGAEKDETIPAGTATASSSFMVGYRAFWGYMTDAEANDLTSDLVRGLEHSNTIINPSASSITLLNADDTVPAGEDLIITAPEGYKLGEVVNKDDISFAEGFSKTSLTVKCAGASTKKYNVYRYDNQSDYPMDIKKITIIKE